MQILLIEDHALFRDGVRLILQKLDADIQIIYGESATQAQEQAANTATLDLVLLDYHLKESNAFDCLSDIQELHPHTPIMMLSAEQNSALIQKSLESGAKGFITKSSSAEVMISAIQLVLAGGIYVPPEILSTSSSGLKSRPDDLQKIKPIIIKKKNSQTYHLTARQLEVLKYMLQGQSNKEIAHSLNISPSTAKVHVAAIIKELEAKNRIQAVNIAIQNSLVTPQD